MHRISPRRPEEGQQDFDEPHAAFAIGRRLRLGEARQPGVLDAAEFAVDVGGRDIQVRERRDGAGYLLIQSSLRGRSRLRNAQFVWGILTGRLAVTEA